jgi:Domain of unknown function (DUF5047)
MWTTSARFAEAIAGTHRAVTRVRLLALPGQTGVDPVDALELPLLSGDVRRSAVADVKGTLTLRVPGDYWDLLQPFGAELFVERGIDFGDGTREYVPLGYYRVDKLEQEKRPHGPIDLDGSDRTAQLRQVRVIYPYQVPVGATHREIFQTLVNGAATGSGTYGMYVGVQVPIIWDDAGYDPDAATVVSGPVVDDYAYDFLAKLVDARNATIRFRRTGELEVVSSNPPTDQPADFVLRDGRTGTLVQASRSVSRDGVVNIVRSTGSDPAYQTGYRLAYITDPVSPIRWNGPFGAAVRYYASPVLTTSEEADAAAETILARSTGLPTSLDLWTVPNPALDPLDVARVIVGTQPAEGHTVDEITCPLAGQSPLQVRTRTLNTVPDNPTDPEPPVVDPPAEPGEPGNPDPGGPSTPGGGSSEDGVQAGLLFGWGTRLVNLEYASAADMNQWGRYDGPGHGGNGRRSPGAFSVQDGVFRIHGENKVSGGAALNHRRGDRRYFVECRARVYNTGPGGDRYHPVLILWPDNDQWPSGAEYDFMECDEGTGQFGLYMHLPDHQPYRQDFYGQPLDLQNWHNYAVAWDGPGRTLKAYIDGQLVYNGQGRVADAPGPMHLTFQLDDFGGNPRPCNFDMAWTRVYQGPGL